MLFSLIDLVDRALSLDARQRPGFRTAPARLQGMTPDVREEGCLNVAPLVWRREDMTGALQGPAGVLEERGLRVSSLSSADGFVLEKVHLAVRTKGGFRNHDWIVSALREVSGWCPPESDAPGRRIYVTRRGALRRPLFNEPAVLEALAPFGFEVVDCASLSVTGQRALFATAEIVVAPHGAGLTNIVWARPGTKLIELMPRGHANPCFMDLASQAGATYGVVPSAVEEGGVNPIYAGFGVDPADVAVLVRRMLDG